MHRLVGPITIIHVEWAASWRGFKAEEGAAALTLRFQSVVGSLFVADNLPSLVNFDQETDGNPLILKAGLNF